VLPQQSQQIVIRIDQRLCQYRQPIIGGVFGRQPFHLGGRQLTEQELLQLDLISVRHDWHGNRSRQSSMGDQYQ
jgi:hypothetical protein